MVLLGKITAQSWDKRTLQAIPLATPTQLHHFLSYSLSPPALCPAHSLFLPTLG